MLKKKIFITGTDTDCGKTYATVKMLENLKAMDKRTIALKPVAAGGIETPDGFQNEDALALQKSATVELIYEQVNPVCFEKPIAPHLAAQDQKRVYRNSQLEGWCRGALMQPHDVAIVEGAGGWMVPLSMQEDLSGLAKLMKLDVVLVVGMKLGCINHALLTAQAIKMSGSHLAGWVANVTDPNMEYLEQNIATLEKLVPAPRIATIGYKEEQPEIHWDRMLPNS